MNEPFIIARFSDDTRWKIPAKIVAMNRAAYYHNKDHEDGSPEEATRTMSKEYYYTMGDDDELLDWAKNNLNWEDVKDSAEQLPSIPKEVNYDVEWPNAEMTVERI